MGVTKSKILIYSLALGLSAATAVYLYQSNKNQNTSSHISGGKDTSLVDVLDFPKSNYSAVEQLALTHQEFIKSIEEFKVESKRYSKELKENQTKLSKLHDLKNKYENKLDNAEDDSTKTRILSEYKRKLSDLVEDN
ncbi:hypothetical protein J4471_02680 [Candidatus Woesearchaeota archaeon]|nr:hypothetical protein [Candidatus Woesearchaeota archaeon]